MIIPHIYHRDPPIHGHSPDTKIRGVRIFSGLGRVVKVRPVGEGTSSADSVGVYLVAAAEEEVRGGGGGGVENQLHGGGGGGKVERGAERGGGGGEWDGAGGLLAGEEDEEAKRWMILSEALAKVITDTLYTADKEIDTRSLLSEELSETTSISEMTSSSGLPSWVEDEDNIFKEI
ncbi:hypothetical protein EV426DRAFT_700453 [Tirmania nivea]|nr:hypothetical protein EV426DRAFT_700453 [Tirmania nivea]